ncbi:MAG: hypothetical protein B7Y56_01030 [Gallionellales bacterium 35-53-114]|jgi:hypothetical protein|nr:MAG: hypothetical protein B7Y56_01030 [Gallionellales bacterium 35-53-114]OYZ64219.1 MAG: hypothetical protein B7Y04_04815 [Gallionellales bacterium 24-53-125]OZB10471.1 MAG: hypothetical protein B7X61_02890 [Gallionellales bacterium 39-52-133]HQS57089.1 GFA family protein [Gallionellaceae bacterium]HQS74723.1 GFA family protein [Gallionellaceae bacterium]
MELTGACGCGTVNYKITGPLKAVVNCHCNMCRKNNGASFSTYCVVAQSDLNIAKGRENIATYEASGGVQKRGCSKCGSPLYQSHHHYPDMFMIHHGSLSESSTVSPSFNVFCENKLPWVDKLFEIKNFSQAAAR